MRKDSYIASSHCKLLLEKLDDNSAFSGELASFVNVSQLVHFMQSSVNSCNTVVYAHIYG